jgi:hypothetical protein
MEPGFHTLRNKDSKNELKTVLSSSVNKKITRATLGSREDRSRLIKEQNRFIPYSVINSPKITDDEIVAYAGNKNLSKEVPFLISTEREFTKKYMVKVALVNNPLKNIDECHNVVIFHKIQVE